MKYAIGSCVVLLACLCMGAFIVRLLGRRHGVAWGRGTRAVLTSVIAAALFLVAGLAYLLPYAPADQSARESLQGTADVEVHKIPGGYFFDGPGTRSALVFYPGAKVDAVAYAPLLLETAAGGEDCFLVDPPLHMAMFAPGAASQIMGAYDYDSWAVGGHSMGGTVAAANACSDPQSIDALVLLAAYPTRAVPDDVRLLSIYGTLDGVLERPVYEESRQYWPSDSREVVVEGGNHAQFGCYGEQAGDNPAAIAPEAQRSQTAGEIIEWLGTDARG